jgi:tRNA(Leu) C34 or U34 (ribose-2'-O)-methylase TrmL
MCTHTHTHTHTCMRIPMEWGLRSLNLMVKMFLSVVMQVLGSTSTP